MTTWMLVEDEPDLYDVLSHMYTVLGAKSLAFQTGEEALAWIDAVDHGQYNGEMPQIALLDIRLPNRVQGDMVGARLRRSPALTHMPILLMTAYRLSHTEENAVIQRAGAKQLIYKPLPPQREIAALFRKLIMT